MNGQRSRKLLYFTGLYLVSVPLTSAQDTIGGNQGIQDSLLEFINTILVFNIDSVQGVLLYFLAPIAGFYFVQKNMLSYGFELFEERIDRQTYGRTDDDIPNGIKGLSIVTSFITVQMLGRVSPGILFATALISILLGALMQLGLLQEMGGGGSSSSSSGSSSTGSSSGGSGNTGGQGGGQSQSGGSNVNWGQLGQTAANFANNVSQNQKKKRNQSIKDALSVFSSGTDVISIIDQEPSDFRNHLTQIQNAERDEAENLNSLTNALDRMKDIEKKMGNMQGYATEDIQDSNDWPSSRLRNQFKGWDMSDTNIANMLRKTRNDLQRIKEDQKNISSTLQDQLDKSWEDIKAYIKIHEFSQKLPTNPEKVAKRDNLLSELAGEARNRNLANGRGQNQAKRDFKSALEKLGQYESTHQTLLENFESELTQELKISKNDGEELKRISNQDKAIISTAENVDQLLSQISSGSGANPSQNEVENKLGIIKGLGEEIENEVQDIYSVIESEGKFENKSYERLKDLT